MEYIQFAISEIDYKQKCSSLKAKLKVIVSTIYMLNNVATKVYPTIRLI